MSENQEHWMIDIWKKCDHRESSGVEPDKIRLVGGGTEAEWGGGPCIVCHGEAKIRDSITLEKLKEMMNRSRSVEEY